MSVAPIGKNLVNVSRTLTTASTAIFVPFTTMELYQKEVCTTVLMHFQETLSSSIVTA